MMLAQSALTHWQRSSTKYLRTPPLCKLLTSFHSLSSAYHDGQRSSISLFFASSILCNKHGSYKCILPVSFFHHGHFDSHNLFWGFPPIFAPSFILFQSFRSLKLSTLLLISVSRTKRPLVTHLPISSTGFEERDISDVISAWGSDCSPSKSLGFHANKSIIEELDRHKSENITCSSYA